MALLLYACTENPIGTSTLVKDSDQLQEAINTAEAGDVIVMANGTWNDTQIKFYGQGTEERPITLKAEDAGHSVISYRISKDTVAFHSRVTNCVIEDYTQPSRLDSDQWITFCGRHNMLDHNYIAGKSNDGATLRVIQSGRQNMNNHHQIVHNYFGPRPRKGGPRAETIRVGDSRTSMTPGYVNVSHNYFEACNGEVEIISDKTNFNTFENNVFYKCEGSLVMRHSNFNKVNGNLFIGGDESDFYGGLRVINTGHWITNNYFYKINGSVFRSPLASLTT